MKNKKIITIIQLIICLNSISVFSQSNYNYFSIENVDDNHHKVMKINKELSNSTTLSGLSNQSISSLSVSAKIKLNNYDSYVRFIMKDGINKIEYLIYEAFYPKDDIYYSINIKDYAYETYSLLNVIVEDIKVEINNAECEIKEFSYSTKENQKVASQHKQDKVKHKAKQDSLIVLKINYNLKNSNKKWLAKETDITKMTYSQRKNILPKNDKGEIPNLQGFEFYAGGIFEVMTGVGNSTTSYSKKTNSLYVADFDWRNRHGMNWMTSIKSQQCNHCWAFCPVGVAEALVNIFL